MGNITVWLAKHVDCHGNLALVPLMYAALMPRI